MPAVPTATVPSVAPAENAGVPYQTSAGATPEAFGASIGSAEQGFGRQLEQTGDMLAKHALRMQEDANVTSAEKLFLDQDIKLSSLTEQYNSLQGSARVNGLPKFHEDASALREEGLNSAPNNDVKKKFDQLFTRQLGFSIKAAGRESASAFRADQKATSAAIKENSFNNIAKNAQDDTQFLAATQNALTSQRSLPEYQGASDEVKLYMDRSLISGAWTTRLQSMAKDDPLRARDLYKKNIESIDGDARLKLEPFIDQHIIQRDTAVQSDKIISDIGTGTMEERLKKLEGYSEKPYWDYKQTTSGYGTKAQPGDENIPPEQRKGIYTQRLRNELSSAYQIVDNAFPGLPKGARDALADLTFNAGSGWTQQGLGAAVREGDMEKAKGLLGAYVNVTNPDGSKSPLPALVSRRAAELSWWNTDTGAATDTVGLESKALDKAKERAVSVFPDQPENQAAYLDALQRKITTDTRIMRKAATDTQLQLRSLVSDEIASKKITSVGQMTPDMQDRYFSGAGGLRSIWDKQMLNISKEDVPRTPERAANWDKFYGMDWEDAMKVNLDDWDLTKKDKERGIKMQADQKELVARGAKIAPAMQAMDGLLNAAKISKTNNANDYFKFKGAYEQALNSKMKEKNRDLTPDEEREVGQSLLKEIVTGPGYFGGLLGDRTSRAYRAIAGKTPIPVADIAAARALPSGTTFILNGETRTRK